MCLSMSTIYDWYQVRDESRTKTNSSGGGLVRQGVGCPAESTPNIPPIASSVGYVTDEPWNYPETKRSLSKGGRTLPPLRLHSTEVVHSLGKGKVIGSSPIGGSRN